jgi:hypothetical protein
MFYYTRRNEESKLFLACHWCKTWALAMRDVGEHGCKYTGLGDTKERVSEINYTMTL